MTHAFRAFAQFDPELPDELAPLSAPRTRAANIFEVLYASLAPSSQRHFDAVARSAREISPITGPIGSTRSGVDCQNVNLGKRRT